MNLTDMGFTDEETVIAPGQPLEVLPRPSDMGFTEEEMAILDATGVLSRNGLLTPTFEFSTLAHVDWWCWKQRQMEEEAAAIQRIAAEKVAALDKARESFRKRFEPLARQIVLDNLPRNREGEIKSKSLRLDRVKVQLRSQPGGPKVGDAGATLHHILNMKYGTAPEALAEAVKVTRESKLVGVQALRAWLSAPSDWKPSLLLDPVKKYVASLPHKTNAEGEDLGPDTIPGVVIEPPSEKLTWE